MLMMKSMAQELAPHRFRANSIGPGAIKTSINRMAWETPEAEAELLKLIPYERVDLKTSLELGEWRSIPDSQPAVSRFFEGGE
jgi:glucose 1-dehydrogenase